MNPKTFGLVAIAIGLVALACLAQALPIDAAALVAVASSHAFPLAALAGAPMGVLRTKDRRDEDDETPIAEVARKVGDMVKDVKKFGDDTKETVVEIKARLTELEQKAARERGAANDHDGGESIGAEFAKSEEFADVGKERARNAKRFAKRGVKALVSLNGYITGSINTGYPVTPQFLGMVQPALPVPRLIDALPNREVISDSVEFIQLNSTGGADYQEGQGALKTEKTFNGVALAAKIQTIAVWTTVSSQLLNDVRGLELEIDRIFRNDLAMKAQQEILTGDTTKFHVPGLLTQATPVTGVTGTPADRLGFVVATMADQGFTPSLIVMSRPEWFGIQVTKDDNSNYIFGSPSAPLLPALWGVRIVIAPGLPANTALVIDTSRVDVLDRESPSLYITRDHSDYATRNLALLLSEMRIGLAVYDVLGVRKVTLAE